MAGNNEYSKKELKNLGFKTQKAVTSNLRPNYLIIWFNKIKRDSKMKGGNIRKDCRSLFQRLVQILIKESSSQFNLNNKFRNLKLINNHVQAKPNKDQLLQKLIKFRLHKASKTVLEIMTI